MATEGKLLRVPPPTYRAKLFEAGRFKVAGTLDGFIDLATPAGTYQLTADEALALAHALKDSVADVEANCLYDRDVLLEER